MSTKYKIRDQNELYYITFSVINWIDVFSRSDYKDIFTESLKHCQNHKSLELYAYCIMTNHVHMVVGTQGPYKIEGIVRDIKKYTSVKIIQAIKNNPNESRREWMVWIACPDLYRDLNGPARKTATIRAINSGNRIIIR